MSMLYHAARNGDEIRLYEDRSKSCPFIVAFSRNGSYFRPLLAADNFRDAYTYYNQLLA